MTNTETRLRDYLDAKAATIPDEPQPDGMQLTGPRRRTWPVVLAAAALAAILVITVSVATRNGDRKPPPPVDKPAYGLTVPYVTMQADQTKVATLHDGKQSVTIPPRTPQIAGRAGGGWLLIRGGGLGESAARTGILMPDGSFVPLGPTGTAWPQLSPDRSRVAMARSLGHGKSQVLVIDIASRKQVAAITLPQATARIMAWNKDGIWLVDDDKKAPQPMLWQPGSVGPRLIRLPDWNLGLVAPAGTDTVLMTTGSGTNDKDFKWCFKAGTLQGDQLAVTREYCGKGGPYNYPELSPDGRTMLLANLGLAVDIATGKTTKLQIDRENLIGTPQLVFDDATHFIAPLNTWGTQTGADGRQIPGASTTPVYRCDIQTGQCEVLFNTPEGTGFWIQRP